MSRIPLQASRFRINSECDDALFDRQMLVWFLRVCVLFPFWKAARCPCLTGPVTQSTSNDD